LGLAVILLTFAIKLILSPFSYQAIVAQVKNKKIQPFIEKIKKDSPDDKQEQAKKQLEIYQKLKVNPFSGCLPTIIQIVVVFALYRLLREGFSVDTTLLYSFFDNPELISTNFLWIKDVNVANGVLAVIAGVLQFIQIQLSPALKKEKKKEKDVTVDDKSLNPMAMMQDQMGVFMRFGMPIMITVFGFMFPAALVLYWVTNTIFTIGQEVLIKGRLKRIEEDIDLQLRELNL
jgi:YidC/Oxa1 family membrane protein insertase